MLNPFRRGFMDPYADFIRSSQELGSGSSPLPRSIEETRQRPWAPPMDVITRDSDLVLKMELPGVRHEDLDISLSGRILTVSGENREESSSEREGYHSHEIRYGSFRRSMQVPEGTKSNDISARFDSGVLEVTVKGAATRQEPEHIQIEGSSQSQQQQ